MFSFDRDRSGGHLFVEMFVHGSGYGSFPAFSLTPQQDGEWYSYFVKQFEEIWNLATPWKPEQI
jgi:hypothetical protein